MSSGLPSALLLSVLKCAKFFPTQGLPAVPLLPALSGFFAWLDPTHGNGLRYHFPVRALPQSGYVPVFHSSGVLYFSFETLV